MSEMTYTKLEMTFEQSSGAGYQLSMGLRVAGSDADQRIPPENIPLEPGILKNFADDIEEYSQALTLQVFAKESCRTLLASARMFSQLSRSPLRIQIVIGPNAAELHSIIWEALRDPKTGPIYDPETKEIRSPQMIFGRFQTTPLESEKNSS